ncbi:MAG: SAM-dependent methyltransferase [Rhizobiaceae bacterium]
MTPLHQRLLRQIALEGPIRLSDYWTQCLFDPQHGYYTTGYPIGADGDFTTAPEISQMFGELLAAWWLATVRQNDLQNVALVEIGPGRGTLMADMLRTVAKLDPDLQRRLQVHMVEVSPRLMAIQKDKLAKGGFQVEWHSSIATLPQVPLGVIANELFDAIAIRAFIKHEGQWHEDAVGSRDGKALVLQAIPASVDAAILPPGHEAQPDGTVFEYAPAREALMGEIAERLARQGGFGLFIDYGHAQSGFGDTLQAMKKHAYANPLETPGEADLTSHVDFEALAKTAKQQGVRVATLVDQGTFLTRLGIIERTAQLAKSRLELSDSLKSACDRLTSGEQMGSLFKVLGIAAQDTALPGLDLPG